MNKLSASILVTFFITVSFITVFSSVLASSELVEDSWNTKRPMSQARYALGVIAAADKIYAIGGVSADGYEVSTNECYDSKTDTWTTLTSMSTPMSYFAIATYEGKIYCIRAGDVTMVYDIITDSWSTKASSPFLSAGMPITAQVMDGKIFVIDAQNLKMCQYDPVTDSWIEKASLPEQQFVHYVGQGTSAVVDNKIFVRCHIIQHHYAWKKDIDLIYNPKTDTWSEKGSYPDNHFAGYHNVAGVTIGCFAPQRIWIFRPDSTFVYESVNNAWSTTKAMPTERQGFGVAVVDDVLYVIGGYTDLSFDLRSGPKEIVSVNEQYVPIGYNSLGYQTPRSFLTGFVVAIAIVLTICVIVTLVFPLLYI